MTQSAPLRLALLALIWGSSFLWIKLADRRSVTMTVLAGIALVLAGVALTRHRAGSRPPQGDEMGPVSTSKG